MRYTISVISIIMILLSAQLKGQMHRFSREGEFIIDTSVVYTNAGNKQTYPAVAFDGTNYLVVWHDERDQYSADIYCARLNQNGIILDSAGIVVSMLTSHSSLPAVIFDGSNYFIVWTDWRNDPGDWSNMDIYGARISQSGVVLDSGGIAISTAAGVQNWPNVAFDGANYLVVWNDYSSYFIYGARVSTSGVLLDPSGIRIASESSLFPTVIFGEDTYFVVWEDYRNDFLDVYGARVDTSGAVLDTLGIAISTAVGEQYGARASFDGTNFFVIWSDFRTGTKDIYGARINASGVILDTMGIFICPTGDPWTWFNNISFDGTNHFIVWMDLRGSNFDIYGTRVNPSGVVLDTTGIPISTNTQYDEALPTLVYGESDYLVVWEEAPDIAGARVNTSGIVIDTVGIPIAIAANEQLNSSIAYDGSNYFIVWEDNQNGSFDYNIRGIRIDADGSMLDSTAMTISSAIQRQLNPSIVFGGFNYFITWQDYRNSGYPDIYGARINQSGVVLDTTGIAVSTVNRHQYDPKISFDGTNYLVVWADTRSTIRNDIYGTRINQAGTLLDPTGLNLSTTTIADKTYPTIAFDGLNYFIVWTDWRNDPGNRTNLDIYGVRVNQIGVVLDTGDIAISTLSGNQEHPAVAFDGANYLVIWQDNRNNSIYADIYGARINQAGIVLDTTGIPISTSSNHLFSPAVEFNGTDFLVMWSNQCPGTLNDIYGAKVSTSGMIVDTFVVTSQTGNQHAPAVTKGQGDQVLVTYTCWTDSINNRPSNSLRIWGKFSPFVGIEHDKRSSNYITNLHMYVYPNPAVGQLCISYTLSKETIVDLSIFDVTGRLTEVIYNGTQRTGTYEKLFHTASLSQGVYFIKITTDNYSQVKKVIFIR